MTKTLTEAPPGALTEQELRIIEVGQIIYKVWSEINGVRGKLTKATIEGHLDDGKIATVVPQDTIYFSTWFKRERGYLFTNYFHAYAYSLKCKERAGGRGTV